ncbi:MAG: hydantoinase/oxoprolinase N-terminal domain-containing protein [Candidatus Puniceispirillales bacterium]
MAYILGLDTGGTFTDAALIETGSGALIAKAKAPTTRADLSIGLGQAINSVLEKLSADERPKLRRVCLSTTLATNAVVEGMGGRIGLVMIGFSESSLGKNNLGHSLGHDPVAFIDGGHKTDGKPQAQLDIAALEEFAKKHKNEISALALAGHFATRNPEHEIMARDLLREITGCPVTCSHELSSELGGPKRALTALLNARLINLLDRQITATKGILDQAGLVADLMVVKGDGSLISEDVACIKPVETILSGPAASISGAAHLAAVKDAIISDIGGTTTDITIMTNGTPRLSSKGATVGGWSTMVEAADIRTSGLGGDSEVRLMDRGVQGGVILGPRRSVPISSLAMTSPEIMKTLDEQLENPVPSATDARFVVPVFSGDPPDWLTRSEYRMALTCRDRGVSAISELAETRLALGAIDRLVSRGLVLIASFTPTDAAHILGHFDGFDNIAALKAGQLMARQRTGAGKRQAETPEQFSEMVVDQLSLQSSLSLVDAVNAHAGKPNDMSAQNPVLNSMIRAAIQQKKTPTNDDFLSARVKLHKPLVALGASAACYYPAIGAVLEAELIVPKDADVAGAIGAAVGSIRQSTRITITQPADGIFRVHLIKGPSDYSELEAALEHAERAACNEAELKAKAAGGTDIHTESFRKVDSIDVGGGKTLFIEAVVSATASAHIF